MCQSVHAVLGILGGYNKALYNGLLKQQTFTSHSLETSKSKVKVLIGLVPDESPLPGLQAAVSSRGVEAWEPL